MKAIWIIDDDKSIRWVFEKALARTDLNFKTFSSIKDALAAIKDEEPQVIVSDIRMPQGSGLELLQVIKEKYTHIPVIIMTAYSDLESAVAAFQGGAFEYLAKPFDVDQAIEIIQGLLIVPRQLGRLWCFIVEPALPEIRIALHVVSYI